MDRRNFLRSLLVAPVAAALAKTAPAAAVPIVLPKEFGSVIELPPDVSLFNDRHHDRVRKQWARNWRRAHPIQPRFSYKTRSHVDVLVDRLFDDLDKSLGVK